MRGHLLTILPGQQEPLSRALERPPTLAQLQEAVGGYIEQIPGFTTVDGARCLAFCNEYGKQQKLAINLRATRLWHLALPAPGLLAEDGSLADILVGPIAVVLGDDELLEEM